MRPYLILAIGAIALPTPSSAERPATEARRPAIHAWAEELDSTFRRLPHASGQPDLGVTSVQTTCDRSRAVFESARVQLYPTPTPELDRSFTEYIDALLALYRECPKDRIRALRLHERANRLGSRFESLVNRTLDREAAGRRRSPRWRASDGI